MIELLIALLVVVVSLLLWYLDKVLDENRELKMTIRELVDDARRKVDMETSEQIYEKFPHDETDHHSTDSINDELEEVSDEDAQNAQRALVLCQYCEGFLGDDDDCFDIDDFKEKMKKTIGFAQKIEDDFFRDAAYHKIVVLLARAGLPGSAKRILSRVSTEMIREKILEDLEKFSKEAELIDRVGGAGNG